MEKAILKTLIYSDIFDYPLKAYEIHKWLIGKSATLQLVEKSLTRLIQASKVKTKKGYFFLPAREGIVRKREQKEKQSKRLLFKAKLATWFLKLIPTLKLVGVSGGLALDNAQRQDDIDLFLITSKNRLWLSRILVIGILDFWGVRRKAKMNFIQAAGKICTNILLEEDKLEQENKDLYTAHEVLQMRVLWQKGDAYKKYLEKNSWVFEFLPNWTTGQSQNSNVKIQNYNSNLKIFDLLEKLAKWLQLKIMRKPQGNERILEGALYFHPNDVRQKVLTDFRQKLKSLSNT